MQLTKFGDYSLRVLIFLARRYGLHTTIGDLAAANRISKNHLMKVVHNLSKRGYVKAVRGRGGGISLARAAADISIGRVIRDVEPLTPAECFVPGYDAACTLYPKCALIGMLRAAQSSFLTTLDTMTIADVVTARRPGVARQARADLRPAPAPIKR